jgi:branched-chain amino acid transport system substrate-binding protein
MAELGLPNFGPDINNSCDSHGGPGTGAIQQWDAGSKTWSLITEFTGADREVVDALIMEDSAAFAAENNITPRDCG